MRRPTTKGEWRGNLWLPDPSASFVPKKGSVSITYGYLMRKYGFSAIRYIDEEPDFSPFENVSIIGHVELDTFSAERRGAGGTYEMASQQAAILLSQKTGEEWTRKRVDEYMKAHNLVWHECGDRKTLRAIPEELNAAFPHTGGISIERSMDVTAQVFDEMLDHKKMVIERDGGLGTIHLDAEILEQAIQSSKERLKKTKKE